ncbi:MAG: DNA replication complex GINS family protein [Candidatus Altiarchaeota archaeon]|nr:DNA replication complex GINS family protein [Candidatus Altiarchaeota archaeon]
MNTSDLIKIWRVEKGASQLEKLPADFYSNSRKLLESVDSNPYEKAKVQELFNEIVATRQHKMLMTVLRNIQGEEKPKNLAGLEEEVYRKILEELRTMRLGKVMKEKPRVEEGDSYGGETAAEETEAEPQEEKKEEPEVVEEPKKAKEEVFKQKTENKGNLRRVRFLKPMPAFVGSDLQTMGPFKEDEVVEIPDELADILIKNDAVEEA